MKICFIGSVYARNHKDYEVPWLRILVNKLAASGHDITLFVPSFRGLATHAIDGIPVQRFRYFLAPWETLTHDEGAPNKIHKLHYKIITLFYIAAGTMGLSWLHLRKRFDILHVHWSFPHGIFSEVARHCAPTKVVLTFYGAELLLVNKFPFVALFLKQFIKNANGVIAISEFTGSKVRALYERTITIIPYGSTIPPNPETRPTTPHAILSVGRVVERKGFEYLIACMPTVLAEYPDATLTIAGGGPLVPELKSLAEKLSLSRSVFLPGKIPDETLRDLFARCEVFVLPAIIDHKGDTEGLGVVLLEALSYKKPVIGTNVGGIPDVITHNKTGLLIPQKDPVALALAICTTFNAPLEAQSLAEAGFAHAHDYFSWDRIVQSVNNVYSSTQIAQSTQG